MDILSYELGAKSGGGTITETDPIFSQSAAAGITSQDIEKWNSASGSSGDFIFYNLSIWETSSDTTGSLNMNNERKTALLTMFNECYQNNKIPVVIISPENFPIYLVGQYYIDSNNVSNYNLKGVFTVGDNANRTDPNNSNKFGLAQLICKMKIENGTIVANGTQAWTLYFKKEQYLPTDNEYSYTPTSNYHPATKKYVDDSITTAITSALGGNY